MIPALPEKWQRMLDKFDFAFQPIVGLRDGACHGFEALLRNYEAFGFAKPGDVFDAAFEDRVLYALDLGLRIKALGKSKASGLIDFACLFYNLDNRVLAMPDYSTGNTMDILRALDISPISICFEVSERHEYKGQASVREILNQYKRQGFKIAVDDYGSEYAGLRMLYYSEPHIIKIDRFFVAGMDSDPRKRFFVGTIVSMAHRSGAIVIAEGVETKEEYLAARKIGCDFAQGYFIMRPQIDCSLLSYRYPRLSELVRETELA